MKDDSTMYHVDNSTGAELEYEIGYKRPPIGTRFQPGKSGNPRGRPRGRKSTSQLVEHLLAERVTLSVNGKRKRLDLEEVVARTLINKAVAGDIRAIRLLDELRIKDAAVAGEDVEISDEQDDVLIAAALERRAKISGATE